MFGSKRLSNCTFPVIVVPLLYELDNVFELFCISVVISAIILANKLFEDI